MEKIKLKRRPGKSPFELGKTDDSPSCPDIWETESGDYIVVGLDVTNDVDMTLTDAVISKGERVVLIPKEILLSASEGLNKR